MMCKNKQLPVREIDGARFDDFEGFITEIETYIFECGSYIEGNLDRFNDMLRGGYGSPDGGFILRWKNSARSREMLGHRETAKWFESLLDTCHPLNITLVRAKMMEALAGRGPTLFDELVEIITTHGTGGAEAEDCVELLLL